MTQRRYDTVRRVLLNTEIVLIDFGLATAQDEPRSINKGTLAYSAPEALLGLDSSYARDIWSLGCTLLELFTGELVFASNDTPEYIAIVEGVTGLNIYKEILQLAHGVDGNLKFVFPTFISYAKRESRAKVKDANSIDVSCECLDSI
jgi:serine/threonine protein kinase